MGTPGGSAPRRPPFGGARVGQQKSRVSRGECPPTNQRAQPSSQQPAPVMLCVCRARRGEELTEPRSSGSVRVRANAPPLTLYPKLFFLEKSLRV